MVVCAGVLVCFCRCGLLVGSSMVLCCCGVLLVFDWFFVSVGCW